MWAPAACAWWRSRAATSCCPPAWPRSSRAWRSHQHRAAAEAPPHHPGTALRRAQPHLRGLRLQRPLRTAGDGAGAGPDPYRLPYRNPALTVDASHERFTVDHNRCILCTRCVRVCAEIEGAHIWDVMGRGINSIVITDLHDDWGSSACTRCGKCVQVCPTGALSTRARSAPIIPSIPIFCPT
jgi:ferredoxin